MKNFNTNCNITITNMCIGTAIMAGKANSPMEIVDV